MAALSKDLNNTASEFMYISNLMIPPLHLTINIPCLAFLVLSFPSVIENKALPWPHRKWLFILTTLADICFIVLMFNSNLGNTSMRALTCSKTTVDMIFQFVLGVATAQMIKNLEMEENYDNESNVESLIKEYQGMKKGLSPLLFAFYLTNALFIINNTYLCINLDFVRHLTLTYIITCSLMLTYTSLVLEDCFQCFRSLILKLR